MSKKIKNKIGYCDNKDLKIQKSGGHYVYIRNINKNGKCDVNVITSLEDKNNKIVESKIRQVRKGNTYAIPKYDATFSRWSGVTKTPIRNVDVKKIKDIGRKQIKQRHNFFIGKFLK